MLENTEWLVDLRMDGEKPGEYVTVSMVGYLDNYTVVIPDDASVVDLDYRCLVGLDVNIAHVGRRTTRLAEVANQIYKARARSIFTWNVVSGQWANISIWDEVMIKVLRHAHC